MTSVKGDGGDVVNRPAVPVSPSSQQSEPPANPGRFRCFLVHGFEKLIVE